MPNPLLGGTYSDYVRLRTVSRRAPAIQSEMPDWYIDALCTQFDPDLWFPEPGGSNVAVKKICRQCPARAACLEYALEHGLQHGVWGGTSEVERRRLHRDRRAGGSAA